MGINLPLRLNKERQLQCINSLKLDRLKLTTYTEDLFKFELLHARMKIEDQNKAEETKRLLHEKNYQNFTHNSPQKS